MTEYWNIENEKEMDMDIYEWNKSFDTVGCLFAG